MRKDDGYRFSLGWSNNSMEKRAVGELLEALNNRKSDLVVQAVWEYMQRNPEIMNPRAQVVIQVHSTSTDTQMLEKIKQMIEESVRSRLDSMKLSDIQGETGERQECLSQEDLDDMLTNLDIFNQQL